MREMKIRECRLDSNRIENYDNRNYYCPSGYEFWSNVDYGSKCAGYCREIINLLRNRYGYSVQVAEPFDEYGNSINRPDYQKLAIYIRKEDGSKIEEDIDIEVN